MIDRLGALLRTLSPHRSRCLLIAAAALALLVMPTAAQAQFSEGMQDLKLGYAPDPTLTPAAFGAMSTAHAGFERVSVPWISVAPRILRPTFDPSNPADPAYRWASVDSSVRLAAQHHVKMILATFYAPSWAEGPNRPTGANSTFITPGSWDPDPGQFTKFEQAMATRYSGTFPDPLSPGHTLPRVHYWEMWNEPNIPGYFSAPNSVEAYRTLLNDGYVAVKAVHADNTVLAAGTAPVGDIPYSTAPLKFDAGLLCLRRSGKHFRRAGACPQKARFDVLNHHPYAFASSPTKHAYRYNDLLVADMGKLRALLDAAQRLHTINRGRHLLWATEFAWITNPPNTQIGDPPLAAARYVAASMYEMWKAGVSLVVWSPLFDHASSAYITEIGSGLLTVTGQPKLTLTAFAFPFVASVSHRHGSAWGRVPGVRKAKVFVQRKAGRRWKTVSTVRTDKYGVFTARFDARRNATYRAKVSHGQASLPYFSARIPGKRLHNASSSYG